MLSGAVDTLFGKETAIVDNQGFFADVVEGKKLLQIIDLDPIDSNDVSILFQGKHIVAATDGLDHFKVVGAEGIAPVIDEMDFPLDGFSAFQVSGKGLLGTVPEVFFRLYE